MIRNHFRKFDFQKWIFSSILLQLKVINDGKFEVRNRKIDNLSIWTLEFRVAFSLPYSTGVTAIFRLSRS